MTILVAPDSFKGTYTAAEVAAHVASGIHDGGRRATQLPVADGWGGDFRRALPQPSGVIGDCRRR